MPVSPVDRLENRPRSFIPIIGLDPVIFLAPYSARRANLASRNFSRLPPDFRVPVSTHPFHGSSTIPNYSLILLELIRTDLIILDRFLFPLVESKRASNRTKRTLSPFVIEEGKDETSGGGNGLVTREDTREKLRADLPESCSLENKHRAAQQILLSLRREGNREREGKGGS